MLNAQDIVDGIFWKNAGGNVIFRTSGSTGEGSDIVVSKCALLVSARAVNEWLGVDADSVWGLALPMVHVGGFGVAARAYEAGCGFSEFEGKWDGLRCAEWLRRDGVTHLSLVPTQVHDLLAAGVQCAPSLRAVVVGGGKLSADAGQAARDAGWPVLASYGMTEACSQIATQRMDALAVPFADAPMEVLPIWEVGLTAEGLLRLRGAALFSGVMVDGTFIEREGEWFVTKDRVAISRNTILPLGRADSVVKVMGELVDVEAVEKRFLEFARGTVREGTFAVIPIPDPRRENALIAVFESPGSAAEAAFATYQSQAPGPERFTRLLALPSFPRTDLGKLRREELRRMCTEQRSG